MLIKGSHIQSTVADGLATSSARGFELGAAENAPAQANVSS
jgi:hypothetical protein